MDRPWSQEAIDVFINNVCHCAALQIQIMKQRIRLALSAGYPVNATRSIDNCTLLHCVLNTFEDSDVALELIHAGANPLIRDINGRVPGHLAAFYGKLDVCQALGTAWINFELPGGTGTPLEHALSPSGNYAPPVIQYLLPHCTEDTLRAALRAFPIRLRRADFKAMFEEEMATRRRWTVARAAWIAAAVLLL